MLRLLGFLTLVSFSIYSWCGESRLYVGGELGGVRLYDDGGMNNFQDSDGSKVGLRAFGGYQVNPYLAAEVAVDWLGLYEARTPVSDIFNSYSGLTCSALGKIPLTENFSLYGQFGLGLVFVYQDVAAVAGPYLVRDLSWDSSLAALFGAGFSFTLPTAKQVELRAGVQQMIFNVDAYALDANSNVVRDNYDQRIREFYLGMAYHF